MTPILAQIILFAGDFAPTGWMLCNGQLLSIAQYSALFSILGTTYGGNGVTTFALPDLRGRVPLSSGSGPGLSSYPLGESGGTETVTLTSKEMPSHSHTVNAVSSDGNQGNPSNALPAGESSTKGDLWSTASADITMNASMVANTGGSFPHNNLQPFLALNYIIAVEGIYPSRS